MNQFIKCLALMAALCYAVNAQAQEGVTYPRAKSIFPMTLMDVPTLNYNLEDIRNVSNGIRVHSQLGHGFVSAKDRFGYTNGAVHIKPGAHSKEMPQGSTFNINKNGFSVACWVKFPQTPANPEQTVRIMEVTGTGPGFIWDFGIVEDGRVYISRYTNKAGGNNKPWQVKFWESSTVHPGRYMAEHGADTWFFIMVVQEAGQVRMHIGTENGKFDCMYLDYGLDDQPAFKGNPPPIVPSIVMFPTGHSLYLDDFVFWEMPLCRAEAFEYFKGQLAHVPADSLVYPFYTPNENNQYVHEDDVARMDTIARLPGSCMKAPPTVMEAEPPLVAAIAPETPVAEKKHAKITVYPNPATNRVTLDFGEPAAENSPARLGLYDMSGKLVAEKRIDVVKGQRNLVWDNIWQSRIPTGIYVLKCMTGGKQYTATIVMDCGCN